MTGRQIANASVLAGVGSVALSATLDALSLLDYTPLWIALSFPLGAASFGLFAFLSTPPHKRSKP